MRIREVQAIICPCPCGREFLATAEQADQVTAAALAVGKGGVEIAPGVFLPPLAAVLHASTLREPPTELR